MKNKGNGFTGLIVVIAIIWFVASFFTSDDLDVYNQPSGIFHSSRDCIEPENPYSNGTGHYAGYEWGESGKSCGGNSNSFIEGCEEYELQKESYKNCLNN